MKVQVGTKRYYLQSNHTNWSAAGWTIAEQLQKFFPGVPEDGFKRPKEVQLLIYHRNGRLVQQKIQAVGDLVLWDGELIIGCITKSQRTTTVSKHTGMLNIFRRRNKKAMEMCQSCSDVWYDRCAQLLCGKNLSGMSPFKLLRILILSQRPLDF